MPAPLTPVVLLIFAWLAMPPLAPARQGIARTRNVATDCGPSGRNVVADEDDVPVRFRELSAGDRHACLAQMVDSLPPRQRGDRTLVALALERLAREGVVGDPRFVPAILDCVERGPWLEAAICNRILSELTRHRYATAFFSGEARPRLEDTPSTRALAIAAWKQYFAGLERGHAIFDSALYDASLDATTRIRGNLRDALSGVADDRGSEGMWLSVAMTYLKPNRSDDLIQRHASPIVSSFALGSNVRLELRGEGSSMPALPANWAPTPLLSGIAFVIYRPGLDREVIGSAPFDRFEPAPRETFDFYEAFPNLDLAIAFRIATTNVDLRASAVKAVGDSLAALRRLDQSSR